MLWVLKRIIETVLLSTQNKNYNYIYGQELYTEKMWFVLKFSYLVDFMNWNVLIKGACVPYKYYHQNPCIIKPHSGHTYIYYQWCSWELKEPSHIEMVPLSTY